MDPVSLARTYAGRHVLVTGCSGFVGKVWLALALERLPDVGRLYVLIRRKGPQSALQRFEEIVTTSPVFRPLLERHGKDLGVYMGRRIEVVEGDISSPELGLAAPVAERLRRDLDLIVNCAGLVDFNPEVKQAISTNVTGALHAMAFASSCRRAALLHISTCFVAGNRQGRMPEAVVPDYAPNGEPFDAEAEYRDVQAAIARIQAWERTPEADAWAAAEAMRRVRERGRDAANARLIGNMAERERKMRVKREMTEEGDRRAKRWGWTNTYTYSKSLAESLLVRRANGVRWSILRPAIVESALTFPFAGWNEGFNTTGPLIYLLGTTWFRHLPAAANMPFDVVPVDLVCNGITIAGAALLLDRHQPVYQCGTTDRNPLTLGRACELTGLGKRKHLRVHGTDAIERTVLSRWDPVIVDEDTAFSVPNLRRVVEALGKLCRSEEVPDSLRTPATRAAEHMDKTDRRLAQIEVNLELFRPFIRDNRIVFEARALESLPVAEPELGFHPEQIDWRRYWIDVHMVGLRRWCFPQMEGKEAERDHPAVAFKLVAPAEAPAVATGS